MTAAKTKIPGYVVGTWTIDPVHSEVAFIVQHLMVSKIRGKFTEFTGNIVTAENVLDSHAEGEVKMATIDTGNQMRDDDLRGSNFFDIATYPKMTFTSTGLRPDGGTFLLDGDITIRGCPEKSVTPIVAARAVHRRWSSGTRQLSVLDSDQSAVWICYWTDVPVAVGEREESAHGIRSMSLWAVLAARRALSNRTLTSRRHSATADRQVRARGLPPGAGHAATGTRVVLRPRPHRLARQLERP